MSVYNDSAKESAEARCTNRAIAYAQFAAAAVPGCARCIAHYGARRVEAIQRLHRCEFDRPLSTAADGASSFAMVIAEALPRCACGACASVCDGCATRANALRPLVAIRGDPDEQRLTRFGSQGQIGPVTSIHRSSNVPVGVLAQLDALAAFEQRTRSKMACILLEEALDARDEGAADGAQREAAAPLMLESEPLVRVVRRRIGIHIAVALERRVTAAADADRRSRDRMIALLLEEAIRVRSPSAAPALRSRRTA